MPKRASRKAKRKGRHVTMTKHAEQRMKERVGSTGKYANWEQMAQAARYKGRAMHELSDEEVRWCKRNIRHLDKSAQIRVMDGFVFLFRGNSGHARTLVTVIEMRTNQPMVFSDERDRIEVRKEVSAMSEQERKLFEFGGTDYRLSVETYTSNPMAMALLMENPSDSTDYTVLTVNLGKDIGNGSLLQYGSSFVDANGVIAPAVVPLLEEQGIAEPYTRFGETVMKPSGFVDYPLYQFNMEKLQEFDPNGVEKYKNSYMTDFRKEQAKMNEAMFGFAFDYEDEYEDEDNTDLDF